jgi:predicted nucleic acid-binding protein
MTNKPKYIYWDTSVFISYFAVDSERISAINAVLSDIREKGVRVVSSMIAKVEAAFVKREKTAHQTDPDVEVKMDALWGHPLVLLVEVNEPISTLARSMIRAEISQGTQLKMADAIHLATAKWVAQSADLLEIQTYDEKWARFASHFGCPIGPPQVAAPRLPGFQAE